MPTIEERLQTLEQENAIRKKTEELLTIAVRALVSKEAFEHLQDTIEKLQHAVETSQEQNGKLFNVLINQGSLHNERMTHLQGQIIDIDSKLDGRVTVLDSKITRLDSRVTEVQTTIAELQTDMRHRFTGIETALTHLLKLLPETSE
jgi:DNA repair exonuclease SbcCD ATPase subunit